jgi:hypothetical protein
MVCMAIEIFLQRHRFEVTIADGARPGCARWKMRAST